jgi:hypothetical protein
VRFAIRRSRPQRAPGSSTDSRVCTTSLVAPATACVSRAAIGHPLTPAGVAIVGGPSRFAISLTIHSGKHT